MWPRQVPDMAKPDSVIYVTPDLGLVWNIKNPGEPVWKFTFSRPGAKFHLKLGYAESGLDQRHSKIAIRKLNN